MILEVGKYYQTRDGKKVRIFGDNGLSIFRFDALIYNTNILDWEGGHTYTKDGKYLFGLPFASDIVSEWRGDVWKEEKNIDDKIMEILIS